MFKAKLLMAWLSGCMATASYACVAHGEPVMATLFAGSSLLFMAATGASMEERA